MEGDVLVFGSPMSRNIPEEKAIRNTGIERAMQLPMAKKPKRRGIIAIEPLGHVEQTFSLLLKRPSK